MTDRKDPQTIRSAFWMPQALPEGSNFRFENKPVKTTQGDMGDVAGPQPKPLPHTGWHDENLHD